MRLSIITINYNDATGLKKTLDSVAAQDLSSLSNLSTLISPLSIEHIIVDGGSSDGSVDVIKDYESCIVHRQLSISLKWVSEKDKGIYNAMNKGVRMATGDYLLFLNSGDTLADSHVLETINRAELVADVAIGRVNVVDNEHIIAYDHTVNGEISFYNLFLRGIPHQGTLIRRTLQLANLYDEKYRINSDFKFFLQTIILQNCSVQYLPLTISNYDHFGISSTNGELQMKERREIVEDLIPHRILMNYDSVWLHYYEVNRISWLLQHPFWYKIYRAWTTLGMKIFKS